MELRKHHSRVPTTSWRAEGNIASCATGECDADTAESKTWCMCGNFKRENREIPSVPCTAPEGNLQGRSANLSEGTADMNADGKSDGFVVPSTQANKTAPQWRSLSRKGSHRREVLSNCRRRTGLRAGSRVTRTARQPRLVAMYNIVIV